MKLLHGRGKILKSVGLYTELTHDTSDRAIKVAFSTQRSKTLTNQGRLLNSGPIQQPIAAIDFERYLPFEQVLSSNVCIYIKFSCMNEGEALSLIRRCS